jgi:hypothetical protein
MSTRCLLLLSALALLGGCRKGKPELLPEINPPLVQEEVCSWEGRLAGDLLFPCAGGIGWVDADGRIVACDVEAKTVQMVAALPFAVGVPPFLQDGLLILQDPGSGRLAAFDLAGGGITFDSLHLGAPRVLGAGRDGLVLQENGRPALRLWSDPGTVYAPPEGDGTLFNCHFDRERLLVLGRERLFVFRKQDRRFTSLPLPRPAASPFLCAGESIYYGTTRRTLVKLALPLGRIEWELPLGQLLQRQPLAFAGSVVACPDDQNLLQVNRRGSILWWQALGSTMSSDLRALDGHLAALLLNREVRFIDPRRRRVETLKSSGRAAAGPLAYRGSLWFMVRDGQTYRLQRLGSRYGVVIELEPAPLRWLKRSLRFTLTFANLPEPAWECVVRDEGGAEVFRQAMDASPGPVTLAWVPQRAGKFVIHVRVRSRGREWQSEAPVEVLDPLRLVPAFYLHL